MADRMACEIWIGGKFPHGLLDEFPISDLRLDFDATPFDSTTEEGILSARDEDGLLHFADCEAAWGEFAVLEDWLREHNMPFRRHSSGKYSYLPELVEFRPDLGEEIQSITTDSGEPLVCKSELVPILEKMAELRRSDRPLMRSYGPGNDYPANWSRSCRLRCRHCHRFRLWMADPFTRKDDPMNTTRTWKCSDCGTTTEVSYDWLAEHGGPVCEKCDCDMELQPEATVDERFAVVERLVDKADAAGLQPEDIDDLVHDLAASTAADVNNGGLSDQIKYLVEGIGVNKQNGRSMS